ncbi:hypothetical protein ABI_34740 [Asticcacaulis biprosthecium C19]|uniref:DUF1697 domain-containing protein n=1 Tax=Asticcacaulis biprosthecium C19 TaxID=715226 RepID=F4QQG5_9CAUL|nr:DUF1697 domain-containing protein [Asticcacaulis biprosthecium]EGF90452.1 hypothetical protein ABI_34740 [Asticcacaulis biprosthecium C19]
MSNSGKIWIGLFRGINIGGNRMPMKDLVKLLLAEGLTDVKTYIASGNVLFRSDRDEADLTGMIQDLVEKHFGFRTPLFLIDLQHLEKVMAANPFKDREHRGKAQHIFFLKAPASVVKHDRMLELKAETEDYALTEEAFYFYAPDGIGRSKLMEKLGQCLKADMTARNLNTVETLRDMSADLEK